jgi:glycerol-3-phosphate dehydrogenase
MPGCIEDTGGFFVLTPQDDPVYVTSFLEGCHTAGIPTENVDIHQMQREEPLLNPKIQQCFRVPDGSADSFLAAEINALSARQNGAQVLTYHEVVRLTMSSSSSSSQPVVTGALCHDLVKDEDVQINASMVINSSGAWAGIIAATADINLQMVPGKGTMIALNHRIVNTVINRCKLPSDGDILVPTHSVAIMGTTDVRVDDPGYFSIEPWEIRLMLDEGEKIIPKLREFRLLRAWAGVRPLIQESITDSNRDISRGYTLLDHAVRDGIEGIVTITSGKWTTYRKMAEVTVDKVCEILKIDRSCSTHLEVLPSQSDIKQHGNYLGSRLEKIEKNVSYGQLVCECELATLEDLVHAIVQSDAVTIDDIRRDVRLGMGPCQGGFCSYRAAGLLHDLRHPNVEETNVSLRDFLQERWKGNLPILWGQQLRQERLNELIYIGNLNISSLPGNAVSKVSPEGYSRPASVNHPPLKIRYQDENKPTTRNINNPVDVVVIGAGLSGLFTAWRACVGGSTTHVITKGWGAPYWGTGCIDIIKYPADGTKPENHSLIDYLEEFLITNPDHPYAYIGLDLLTQALKSFINLSDEAGYPYYGSINSNFSLPTALGTLRPTCLAPMTMIAGESSLATPMLIVGFKQYHDFYPSLIADNLNAQGILARDISIDLKSLHNRKLVSAIALARLFDDPEFRQEVINMVKPKLGDVGRVGFPAVLGLNLSPQVIRHLESSLGVPVFEIPGLPPSIPGIRLCNMLVSAIQSLHGEVFTGMAVSNIEVDNGSITSVLSDAAARHISHPAKAFVIATGGTLGGGIATSESGYAHESLFSLPININHQRSQWFQDEFISADGHPIHSAGIRVNSDCLPVDEANHILYPNLFAVGDVIGNCDGIHERSLEGIALATAYKVGEELAKRKSL